MIIANIIIFGGKSGMGRAEATAFFWLNQSIGILIPYNPHQFLFTYDLEVHMNLARYGLRCMKLILQHNPLAIAWSFCDYSEVVIAIGFS